MLNYCQHIYVYTQFALIIFLNERSVFKKYLIWMRYFVFFWYCMLAPKKGKNFVDISHR